MPDSASVSAPDTLQALRAGRLAGTTRFSLAAGLREFPREVFALADSLEVLDLSGNALDALPDDLPRLHRLRVLFCSDNRFTELPAVLGRCPQLEMIGFKANRIAHVAADALPPRLRWLILTDNRIETLPETIGDCPRLQKLMLAGNRLRALPVRLGECRRLELLRIAANRFARAADALPDTLLALPRLAWLAHAGNPFGEELEARALGGQASGEQAIADVAWRDLRLGEVLGQGASGVIHRARWQPPGAAPREVAVKLFKGAMTSDGLPRSEMAAGIAAGVHPRIVGAEGRIVGHPQGADGLVMPLLPAGLANLASPPSLASCTRDVYPDGLRLGAARARRIAEGVRDALAHLHMRGLTHGDLYAHNLRVDDEGHAWLGDFGAAGFVPPDDPMRAQALQRLDLRALRVLVDELAARCDDPTALADLQRGD